jgi:hypothetical protein
MDAQAFSACVVLFCVLRPDLPGGNQKIICECIRKNKNSDFGNPGKGNPGPGIWDWKLSYLLYWFIVFAIP